MSVFFFLGWSNYVLKIIDFESPTLVMMEVFIFFKFQLPNNFIQLVSPMNTTFKYA